MTGLEVAKNPLQLRECQKISAQIKCSPQELEKLLQEKFSSAIFVAWQVQNVVWGKFDGEKLLLKDDLAPNFDDWLECRIFNRGKELHLKRDGNIFSGRLISDAEGEGDFYVDSFARLWGENSAEADGWITLRDAPRKLYMEIPCDDGGKKFYGLTTRNYIDSDAATGLSGYVDYRFVAIESAWDGD